MDSATVNDVSDIEDRPRLVMESGPQPGLVILLTHDWLSVGRSSDNDIVLRDLEVSRRHAHLRRSGQGWLLEDLGSTNGTYVNSDRLVSPYLLRHGDIIDLSEAITFTFRHRPLAVTQAIPRYVPPSAAYADPAPDSSRYAAAPAAPSVAGSAYPAASDRGTASFSNEAPRRSGHNPWLLAGIAAGLILIGLLCLAVLAYFILPELGGAVAPGVATMTPPVGISTSVPPTP